MRFLRGVAGVGLALGLAACVGANINDHVQLYNGDAQPDMNTVLIQGGSLHHGRDLMRIVGINGQPVTGDAASHEEGADSVALLPGGYDVKVLYHSTDPQNGLAIYDTLHINTFAGCKYRVVAYHDHQQQQVVFDVLPSANTAVAPNHCVGQRPYGAPPPPPPPR